MVLLRLIHISLIISWTQNGMSHVKKKSVLKFLRKYTASHRRRQWSSKLSVI